MEKGEFYETLTAVINLCVSNQGMKPAAILLGPRQYEDYLLEISGSAIMGKPMKASKSSIHGVPILLSPTPGVDLAFGVEHKEQLMGNIIEQEVKEEA
jgi:hypothetical protein